ncbi:MAG: uroporphyrinogen-III C-methyltransferase [Desulfobacterales bacterium]
MSKVFLVGAGPGDPGLITVKGRQAIERADVVIYDYLAAPELLSFAQPEAELIYVGKKGGEHTLSQSGINDLIVAKARAGRTVTRLKGGDPFIFGRGGEEAEELRAAGIAFEIVPGVTSAVAAPAYAGIPLTHRRHNTSVAFVTGHEDPTKEASTIDWAALATGIGTVVFFMGVKNLPQIVANLCAHGRPQDTAVALIRWGTTPRQQTVTGTLATIEARVKAAGLKAPAIIVVGGVVTLRETLRWFEERPLFGKRILVTRARAQASQFVSELTELGAHCIELPTIRIVPPEDWGPLDAAIQELPRYQWIVFTSVNGVKFFFERLYAQNLDARALGHLKTAAIGPATADRLKQFGLSTDILPENYRAESVVTAFGQQALSSQRILLPRAREARTVLPRELTRMGAEVREVTAYRTQAVPGQADQLRKLLDAQAIDMVTFTSSSTAKNFAALLPEGAPQKLLEGVRIASIGPITTDTAGELGFKVDLTADTYTIPGLCQAIRDYYAP